MTPAQIALSWLFHKPGIVSPIVGIRKVEQLEQAVKALEVNLDDEEILLLEEPYEARPVVGHV